jgi:hypothetical protein
MIMVIMFRKFGSPRIEKIGSPKIERNLGEKKKTEKVEETDNKKKTKEKK